MNSLMSGENFLMTIGFFTLIIVIYSFFVFMFYRLLAKKNFVELNLNKYNRYQNPAVVKFFAALFYIIEYIILLPIVTSFWFAGLAILTLVLSDGIGVATVLMISAALVSAVRVISFISEDLARDLAKMLPFSLLSISITTAGFFGTTNIANSISEVPNLITDLPYYLLFIVGVELVMRILHFIFSLLRITKQLEAEKAVIEETSETE